jgi:hypothetical protein
MCDCFELSFMRRTCHLVVAIATNTATISMDTKSIDASVPVKPLREGANKHATRNRLHPTTNEFQAVNVALRALSHSGAGVFGWAFCEVMDIYYTALTNTLATKNSLRYNPRAPPYQSSLIAVFRRISALFRRSSRSRLLAS